MITDALHTFSNAQVVTVTALGADVADLGPNARDIGPGFPLKVAFGVTATVTGATSVEFQIVTGTDATITTPTVLASSGAVVIAQLTAGRAPIEVTIPPSIVAALGQRYMGVRYVVVGTATAGAFNADGVADVPTPNKHYPSGYTVV